MAGKRGRVLLVTTRVHESLARRVAELLSSTKYSVQVGVVDVAFPSMITEREICGLGVEDAEDLTIIVPGGSRLSGQPGCYKKARVVKGTMHLKALVDLARTLGLERLRPDKPGELAVGSDWWLVVEEALEETRRDYYKSWCVESFCPPSNPPPILVASDLYHSPREDTVIEAERRISEGADLIVLGYGRDKSGYLAVVKELVDKGFPTAVDAPIETMVGGLEAGALIGFSLDINTLDKVPRRLRSEKAFVILPSSLGSYESRVESLQDP